MKTRVFLNSKIHRATVTGADLDYVGSISIDTDLLERARIAPYEQVEVYNVTNGERFTTYAIAGEPGEVCVNGAAAHKASAGDVVIIATYAWLQEADIAGHTPSVVIAGPGNVVVPEQ